MAAAAVNAVLRAALSSRAYRGAAADRGLARLAVALALALAMTLVAAPQGAVFVQPNAAVPARLSQATHGGGQGPGEELRPSGLAGATLVAASLGTVLALRAPRPARRSTVSLEAVGVFYGTQTGNTENVAGQIAEAAGLEEPTDVGSLEDLQGYDGLIVGCPTWNTDADEYRSGTAWDDLVEEISEADFGGIPVAVFGLGDSQGYGDNFCDGIEELHDAFQKGGGKMVGYVDASDYQHAESKSEKDGKFLGLPLDEDNEGDQTADRVAAWVEQLKSEGMPL